MSQVAQFTSLPLGGIIDLYLVRGLLRIFLISLSCFTALFAVVEFFERIGSLLEAGTSVSVAAQYFFFKVPLSLSRIVGFATLFSTLFCLGALSRTQEITAMRSGGVSNHRLAVPLIFIGLLVCGLTFIWNETLVPAFAHRAQTIYQTQIKKKSQQSLFGTKEIWIRAEGGFINIDDFDPKTGTLRGVTVFSVNRDFSLRGLTEVPHAQWNGQRWTAELGTVWRFLESGKIVESKITKPPTLGESPSDLRLLARDREEYSYFDLQKQITDMKSKGLDTTAYEVDLQIKLALPFISPLMVLLALPFGLRRTTSGIALSFGISLVIAFGYWVLSAFCFSLGHNGALNPILAAWIPNAIFTLIGLYTITADS